MAERITSLQQAFWKIYSIICGLAAPLMLLTCFTDDGFINTMALYMSGFFWLLGSGFVILGCALFYERFRVSKIEDSREEANEVKMFPPIAYEDDKEEKVEDLQGDLIKKYCETPGANLSVIEMIGIIQSTQGYDKLHLRLVDLYKDELNLPQLALIQKHIKNNAELKLKINNLRKFWTGSKLAKTRDIYMSKSDYMRQDKAPTPPIEVGDKYVRT